MTSAELATLLCGDLVRQVAEWDQRSFIVTNFKYPDGDLVNLYLDDRSSLFDEDPDAICISDFGTTLFKCRESGVDVTTQSRADVIEAICNVYGLGHADGTFWKRFNRDDAGQACLSFCEAITRISALEYERTSRYVSPIPELIESLLERKVKPSRRLVKRWVDPNVDPGGSHPVDFHVGNNGDARNIFHVTNEEKCTTVDAVTHFLRSRKIVIPTLAVVDPKLQLSGIPLDRLSHATERIEIGVRGNEDSIVRFALA